MTKLVFVVCLLFVTVAATRYDEDESVEFEQRPAILRTSTLDKYRNRQISKEAEELTGDELIEYVNKQNSPWKAKKSKKFSKFSDKVKYGMMGVNHVRHSVKAKQHLAATRDLDVAIPESFDARTNWPDCDSIKAIRDQSSCGSCWAFGAVEAISDRICIASQGDIQVTLSADDLLSCCKSCGFGCNGGDPLSAWKYWVKSGIVTGSNFTQQEGCKPYPFPPCEHHSTKHHFTPCKHDLYPTPKCEKKCVTKFTERTYTEDKFYGKSAYAVDDNVEAIQKELMTYGPLEVAFEVYEDFLAYSSGVYVHTAGKLGGGHAVKLVGWGVDQGLPYWLIANSWNTDFGEDGFFRILRGVDECGIESGVVGGIPKLNTIPRRRIHVKKADDDSDELFF